MAHGWTATNKFSGLAASAFTWSNGASTDREFLNDGKWDRRFSVGSSGSGFSVVIDAGAAIALNAIAVLNSTLGSLVGCSVLVEGADNAGISSGVVTKAASSVATTPPRHKEHVFAFPLATKRYWRLTFAWSGLSALYIGELVGAQLTQLSRSICYGDGENESFATASLQTDSGDVRTNFLGGPFRARRLPFSELRDTERDEVGAMWRAGRGGATPVLWAHELNLTASAATAAEQNVLWGQVAAEWKWGSPDFNLNEVDALVLRTPGREVGS